MREIRIEKSFTNRDADSLNRYLKDLNKFDLINAEEEVILANKIKSGDQMAYEKLVKANLRFVISCAKKYQGIGLPLNDLINEGNIGLMKAARSFDASKGFKFISYAVWWIRQAILAAVSENMRVIRLPMNQILAISKIKQQASELEQIMEREPTIDELATEMEMDADIISNYLKQDKQTKSLEDKISNEDDLEFGGTLIDPNMEETDNGVIQQSFKTETDRLLTILLKRDENIIRQIFGLGEEGAMTLDEVATRNNLSKERIRQIKLHSINKLRSSNIDRLKEYIN